MATHRHSSAPAAADIAADRCRRFTSEALPLRPELERAARRHVHNFHDAEDLVSETYAKAWAGFDSFQEGTNFRAWMHRILINTWIDAYRRSETRPAESLTDSFTDAHLGGVAAQSGSAPSPEDEIFQEIPNEHLLAAMRELPAAHQAVLFYADVCEWPLKRIAELEGIPLGTVMSRTHRARCRMRAALLRRPDDPDPQRLSA